MFNVLLRNRLYRGNRLNDYGLFWRFRCYDWCLRVDLFRLRWFHGLFSFSAGLMSLGPHYDEHLVALHAWTGFNFTNVG